MFNLIRTRLRARAGRHGDAPRNRDARLQLRLPNPFGGRPWLSATVAFATAPHARGETLRLRAHVDSCLRLPDAEGTPSLGHGPAARRSLAASGRRAAASLVRGVLSRLPAERLAPITARRRRSWIDVQFSTAPLDAGAEALTPEPLRRVYGGGLPRLGAGEPRVGFWSGPAGGPAGGLARLVLLQFDERDLGGASGFNLNASAARLIEPANGADDDAPEAGAN